MSPLMPGRDSVDSATPLMSELDFEMWLRHRVSEREPAAVVRLGSAEARLLTADPDDAKSAKAIGSHLKEETGRSLSPADIDKIKALVALAYDQADVLGIRVDERSPEFHKVWMRQLAADYSRRVAAGRPPTSLAHCLLSEDIAESLPELLAGRRVSVISCRDLRPVLEGDWGLREISVYQVPSQHAVRDVDGSYEGAMHGVPIWPDAHDRLSSELSVRERGEVFLVGAGLFGKDLCVRVRDLGGIAVDMGSTLDRLAGKLTRGPERRVLGFYANGMSISEIADNLKRIYDVKVSFERIEEAIASAVSDDLLAWRARPLEASYRDLRIDTLQVEIGEAGPTRTRTCHLALGVTEGDFRDPLGIWWQDTDGVELWLAVLGNLRERGVRKAPVTCGDGVRASLAEAAKLVFDRARVDTATEPIESCAAIRRALAAHGPFADEQAASALIYLALTRAEVRWRNGASSLSSGPRVGTTGT